MHLPSILFSRCFLVNTFDSVDFIFMNKAKSFCNILLLESCDHYKIMSLAFKLGLLAKTKITFLRKKKKICVHLLRFWEVSWSKILSIPLHIILIQNWWFCYCTLFFLYLLTIIFRLCKWMKDHFLFFYDTFTLGDFCLALSASIFLFLESSFTNSTIILETVFFPVITDH